MTFFYFRPTRIYPLIQGKGPSPNIVSYKPLSPWLFVFSREIAHRIPNGYPSYGHYREEYEQHIHIMHAHGVGIDHKTATALTHFHQSVSLLEDRKSTRLNSSHANISYAVFCLKKK